MTLALQRQRCKVKHVIPLLCIINSQTRHVGNEGLLARRCHLTHGKNMLWALAVDSCITNVFVGTGLKQMKYLPWHDAWNFYFDRKPPNISLSAAANRNARMHLEVSRALKDSLGLAASIAYNRYLSAHSESHA